MDTKELRDAAEFFRGQMGGPLGRKLVTDLNQAADEIDTLRSKVERLKRAYFLARSAAAGLSNYCEESTSTRRCEKQLEEAKRMFSDLKGEG